MRTDRDGDPQLFIQFARQARFKRFAGFLLATGELPQPAEQPLRRTTRSPPG